MSISSDYYQRMLELSDDEMIMYKLKYGDTMTMKEFNAAVAARIPVNTWEGLRAEETIKRALKKEE